MVCLRSCCCAAPPVTLERSKSSPPSPCEMGVLVGAGLGVFLGRHLFLGMFSGHKETLGED